MDQISITDKKRRFALPKGVKEIIAIIIVAFSINLIKETIILATATAPRNTEMQTAGSTEKQSENPETQQMVTETIPSQPSQTQTPPKTDTIKILAMGDTALLDPLGPMVVADPTYTPFAKIKPFLDRFDYKIATLEATIDGTSVGTPNPGKSYTFSIPKESVKTFKEAGINAFFYGGNHVKDYGPTSVTHTIQLLNDGGIDSFGSGKNLEDSYKPLIVDIRGTKVAFLGYNCMEYEFNHATFDSPGTASFSEGRVRAAIASAKSQVDVTVVFMHAGNEHDFTPDAEWQVKWAKIFVNAGADIVIGGHPHVIQEDTIIDGVPVFYSIGNFMFPGMAWDPNAQKGQVVEIDISDKKIVDVKKHEILMDNIGVPSLVP